MHIVTKADYIAALTPLITMTHDEGEHSHNCNRIGEQGKGVSADPGDARAHTTEGLRGNT